MESKVLTLDDLLPVGEPIPTEEWQLRAVHSDECLSYLAWNTRTMEGLIVDPKLEDHENYRKLLQEASGVLWMAVVDTHTHADHISDAARMAAELGVPLVMHEASASKRVDLRVSRPAQLSSRAGAVRFIPTPGHTPDGICVIWGPFLFTGDTILYGDTGRDDLPGGDSTAHYLSVQALKAAAAPELVFLPGHDNQGGRASSWATQIKVNGSLTQERENFIREADAFEGPAPKLMKRSLFENLK